MQKFICAFCNTEKDLKTKYTKSGHLANCSDFKKYKSEVLTREYLFKEYVTNERSSIEIAQEHNLESATSIISLLKKYEIKTRNIRESKNDREKAKRSATNLTRYGCSHNFCNDHESRILWMNKMMEDEGISNVFQRQEIIDKISEIKYANGLIVPTKYKTDKRDKYYCAVWRITNKNFNKFYNKINPDNLNRSTHEYHLDHKISILYGFLNDIPPEKIAHHANLEMIYCKDNISKQSNCSLTIEELNERIEEYEKSQN